MILRGQKYSSIDIIFVRIIYIYIYIQREREKEREFQLMKSTFDKISYSTIKDFTN